MKKILSKIKTGLSLSSQKITTGINNLFIDKKLNHEYLNNLEELLIECDLGVSTVIQLVDRLSKKSFYTALTSENIRIALSDEIVKILLPVAKNMSHGVEIKPQVILVVGVNGSGKTTTIGKLAKRYSQQGKKIMLACCDTFRAAAFDQLKIWGQRTNTTVFPHMASPSNMDAASIAFEAFNTAKYEHYDMLIIDTAGRLQNQTNIMAELNKIVRVLHKIDSCIPHDCLLILDATIGQNAHSQVEIFKEYSKVSGLIITKLDGSAKGGVIVSLAAQFNIPIYFIGIGEEDDDLYPFNAQAFADHLMGLNTRKIIE